MAGPATPVETIDHSHPRDNSWVTPALLIVAALTTIVGFASLFATWFQASIDPGAGTLQIAAKQLALGHFATAAALAEQAQLPADAPTDLIALRDFLIGAGLAEEAMLLADKRSRRAELKVAIPSLQAASLNWPPGREDLGDRLLGLALYEMGDYKKAIAPLYEVIQRNPTFREELIPKLAQCYLYGDKEAAAQALRVLDMVDLKSLSTRLSPEELTFLRAESLSRLGRYAEAKELLSGVEQQLRSRPPSNDESPRSLADRVSLLLASADVAEASNRFGNDSNVEPDAAAQSEQFLKEAIDRLTALQRDAAPDVASQASLWLARAIECQGDVEDALGLFSAVRQQQPFTGISIAAGIEEIELYAETGSGEEMLQTARYLVREIGTEQDYDGTIIDFPSFQSRVRSALQTLRSKDKFDYCIAIAKSLPPLFEQADALYEEGVTYRQQAERMMAPLRNLPSNAVASRLVATKQIYRKAGDAFNESAKQRFDTMEFPDTLWQAIDAYQQAGQFEISVELLDDYLKYETRRRQPRAFVALGRARLATGDAPQALAALEECIVEFPRDPMRYDARLYAALAHAEMNHYAEAEKLLDDNLTDGQLTPESQIWKESLYNLGELLYRQAYEQHMQWQLDDPLRQVSTADAIEPLRKAQPTLEKAILKLNEAQARYWPDARAKHAAYLSAKAHRMAAIWPRLESEQVNSLDAAKRQLRVQSDQHLSTALTGFITLRRDLATREEERALTTDQQAMLRNCYIGEADTLFELERFEEATEAFRAVSLRYMNEPVSLEAMLGQSRCLSALKRPREARLVIRQAAIVLGRIPPDVDEQFLTTTRYDRKRWKELLTWLDSGPMPEDDA